MSSHSPVSVLSPSTKKGLLPARRVVGRCAATVTPASGASSRIVAMASISASSRGLGRRGHVLRSRRLRLTRASAVYFGALPASIARIALAASDVAS